MTKSQLNTVLVVLQSIDINKAGIHSIHKDFRGIEIVIDEKLFRDSFPNYTFDGLNDAGYYEISAMINDVRFVAMTKIKDEVQPDLVERVCPTCKHKSQSVDVCYHYKLPLAFAYATCEGRVWEAKREEGKK